VSLSDASRVVRAIDASRAAISARACAFTRLPSALASATAVACASIFAAAAATASNAVRAGDPSGNSCACALPKSRILRNVSYRSVSS
jgi:hypothetical protein